MAQALSATNRAHSPDDDTEAELARLRRRIAELERATTPARHYELVFDILPESVIVNGEPGILYANDAAARMLRASSRQALIGLSIFTFVPPEFMDAAQIRRRQTLYERRELPPTRSRRLALDGSYVDVDTWSGPIEWYGQPAMVTFSRDVTARLAAERAVEQRMEELEKARESSERQRVQLRVLAEQLKRAKEAADAANRTKSEFLANMSHELRTPLNAVMGFAEVIKEQLLGPVGMPQYAEYARDIYASGAHLLEIINDILDLSKIEAGRFELTEERICVEEVATAVVRIVNGRAEARDIQLAAELPHTLPDIIGDKRSVKQMMLNLLSNAIKFTPKGGKVTLRAGLDAHEALWIAVSDTGIGIAPEHLEIVLAPFGQVDSALAREHQGTGLGLPLVKAMIERHDGHLELVSKVGAGTTARLVFPPDRIVADGPAAV
ncbi:MAG: PAS domain-containing sensor histidine kinase [Rhodospirillales bacterium]